MIKPEVLFSYLDEKYPNAHCELVYKKDYEFLIAVMLSAQTTDKAVNQATAVLFKEYKTIEELANADISDVEFIIRNIGMKHVKAGNVVKIAKILTCLCAGAIFCVCLMSLMAIYYPSSDNEEDKDRKPFSPWLILIFALAWTAPWLLSFVKNNIWDGPYFGLAEFVLNFICLAPFFWICIFLLVKSRREEADGHEAGNPVQ